MPEKILKAHVLCKHDSETNWNTSPYTPKQGELIIYDTDSTYSYPRVKIGNGVSTASNLPFERYPTYVWLTNSYDMAGFTVGQETTAISITSQANDTTRTPVAGDYVIDNVGNTGRITQCDTDLATVHAVLIHKSNDGIFRLSIGSASRILNSEVGGSQFVDISDSSSGGISTVTSEPNCRNIKRGSLLFDFNNGSFIVAVAQEDYDPGIGGVSTTTIYADGASIPKAKLSTDVQASLSKADSALQTAPVTSVAGRTGAVTLTKSDVGLGNLDNVRQYSTSNPPPYPVTSVNNKTGNVSLSASDVGALPTTGGTLTGNLTGQYITGTWLQSTAGNHSSSTAQRVCVQDGSGWVYYRTPAELRSDMDAPGLGVQNTWTANQNFNGGFSALNGNFSFSDTTNIGMEIGRKDGTAGTPYIDFHTDGKPGTDYNSRLLATGNQLQFTASGGMTLNSNQILSAVYSKVSFNLNTSYFKQATDSSGNELTNIWRLFGSSSRVYWISINLITTVQLSGGTSYYMINQFGAKGRDVVTGTVMANNHYVAGRGRINRGGDAFWLDVMDSQTIPANTNLVCNVFYLSYS